MSELVVQGVQGLHLVLIPSTSYLFSSWHKPWILTPRSSYFAYLYFCFSLYCAPFLTLIILSFHVLIWLTLFICFILITPPIDLIILILFTFSRRALLHLQIFSIFSTFSYTLTCIYTFPLLHSLNNLLCSYLRFILSFQVFPLLLTMFRMAFYPYHF